MECNNSTSVGLDELFDQNCVKIDLKASVFSGIGVIALLLLMVLLLLVLVCCLGSKLRKIKRYCIALEVL